MAEWESSDKSISIFLKTIAILFVPLFGAKDTMGDIMNTKRKKPEIVLKNGKPTAVILDISDYRKLLERLEDTEDLKELEAMRKRPLEFRKFDDFLKQENLHV